MLAHDATELSPEARSALPAPRLGNTVVDAEGISTFLDNRWLFADLDLSFEPGTCTGITGRNGLGKTTLSGAFLMLA